jgi:hypothetical protein
VLLQLLHAAEAVPAAAACAAIRVLTVLLVVVLRIVQHTPPVGPVPRGRLLTFSSLDYSSMRVLKPCMVPCTRRAGPCCSC